MAGEVNDWTDGYAAGRAAGERFAYKSLQAPSDRRSEHDRLVWLLNQVVTDAAGRRAPDPSLLRELRSLAVKRRRRDWNGTALAAVSILAAHFDDRRARAWLPVMMAGAGRYEDAVTLPHRIGEAGPPPWALISLVSARLMLGDQEGAAEMLAKLREDAQVLREDLVAAWDETAVGREFARLVSGHRPETLPVFYHLPFTGGTSTIVSLKQTVPWSAMAEISRRHGLFQIESLLRLSEEELAHRRLIHQHHAFSLDLPGRKLTYFTVLRDPVSQLSSGYYKRLSTQGIVPTKDHSKTFEEHAQYTIDSGMTNMLARQIVVTHPEFTDAYKRRFSQPGMFRSIDAEEDMYWLEATADLSEDRLLSMCRETLDERFHVVGTMDHLAASHLAGAAAVGLPITRRLVHRGRSGQPKSGLSPDLESRLREANSVDQTLYEEYSEQFRKQHSALIAAVEDDPTEN
ncbi:hypothetical protein [Nesterenkonia sp.]|uniref:hypothetical protein n=1 Tax=Nesterenkonia sp. TaxID=704201 RepID=UPI002613FCEC|nr:hypothetical protein [Nesterenkonia sp.]